MDYGNEEKKITFYITDHLHAKIVVKGMEDGIRLQTLMRQFLIAYTEDDPLIRQWTETYPGVKMSERTIKKRRGQRMRERLFEEKFNLEQKDVEEIFDILADEMGD